VLGRGVGAFADELAGKAVNEVLSVSMTARRLHRGRILRRAEASDRSGKARPGFVSAHIPGARFRPKLAAMLGKGMIGDASAIATRRELVFVRQSVQGKTVAGRFVFSARACFASFKQARFARTWCSHASGKALEKCCRGLKAEQIERAAGPLQRSKVGRG